MMKRAFILCDIFFENPRKVGNLRRRLSVFDGQIPTVGISLKSSDGENKRTPRGLLKPL